MNLTARLMNLNSLDEAEITSLYEETIRRKPSLKEKGAGLGIILIRLKSGNNLDYHFTEINREFSFFEIKIAINKFIMRKLILKETDSSPKVIFDPDKNVFEILQNVINSARDKIILPYSNGHLNDLLKSYKKGERQRVTESLKFISFLTQNVCLSQYWNEENVKWQKEKKWDLRKKGN